MKNLSLEQPVFTTSNIQTANYKLMSLSRYTLPNVIDAVNSMKANVEKLKQGVKDARKD